MAYDTLQIVIVRRNSVCLLSFFLLSNQKEEERFFPHEGHDNRYQRKSFRNIWIISHGVKFEALHTKCSF